MKEPKNNVSIENAKLDESILRKNPPKEYSVITLRNVISFAMQLAFERGKDFIFDGGPYNTGDNFDYRKLYLFMSEDRAFCELCPMDVQYFLQCLKDVYKH